MSKLQKEITWLGTKLANVGYTSTREASTPTCQWCLSFTIRPLKTDQTYKFLKVSYDTTTREFNVD